jgi:hypothetical protein
MKITSIILKQPKFGYINTSPINQWLISNVGQCAFVKRGGVIDEDTPWDCSFSRDEIEFFFAREKDATMFALRWAA